MRALLSWLLWPLLVGGGVAVAYAAFVHGLPAPLALGVVQLGAFVIVASLERWMPEHPSWNVPRDDVRADALHTLVSGLIVSGLARTFVFAAVPSLGLWPSRWPLAAQLPLAILVVDLGSYGTHLLTHRVSWLWPIHAVHHSALRLYWLNTSRMHPLDSAATVLVSLLPLALLGAPAATLVLFDAFTLVHVVLQHSNVRLRFGPFDHVVASAEFHRWHHARERALGEHNYASFLSLWDHLFGTFKMPAAERSHAEVGLYADSDPVPPGWRAQIAHPFRAWVTRADSPAERAP